MTKYQRVSLFALRLALGWLFIYAGITKIFDPAWSAAGYLKGAKTFAVLFGWMLDPSVLPFINFLNVWGLTLLGISLLVGGLIRYSAYAGVVLMTLYYLAAMNFPYPNSHTLLVDEHVIYSIALFVLAVFDVGQIWGFDGWVAGLGKRTEKT